MLTLECKHPYVVWSMRRDWKPKGTCWPCAENRLTVIDKIIVKWNTHSFHHVWKRVAVNNLMWRSATKFKVRQGWALNCRVKIKTSTSFRTLFKDTDSEISWIQHSWTWAQGLVNTARLKGWKKIGLQQASTATLLILALFMTELFVSYGSG